VSDDGLTWRRGKDTPILSVHDKDCGDWEKSCIYQPWLVEHGGRFYSFYNAARGGIEQSGLALSDDLLAWKRHPGNPILRNRKGGYDERFCSDPKVYRDGDHWTCIYFGVGRGGAHILAAFSRDLLHWSQHPELSRWLLMRRDDEAMVDLMGRVASMMEWNPEHASEELADMQREVCYWLRLWPQESARGMLAFRARRMSDRILELSGLLEPAGTAET